MKKYYHLVSPDGEVFEGENLWKFCKEHFPESEWQKAKNGLPMLKPGGKKFVTSWRGWKWNEQNRNCTKCGELIEDCNYKYKDCKKCRKKTYANRKRIKSETHFRAQHWVLKSPQGIIYEFDNLALFCQNNQHLFTPEQNKIRQYGKSRCGKSLIFAALSRLGLDSQQTADGWVCIAREYSGKKDDVE